MATVTVELSEPLKNWIEEKAQADGFDSPGDYIRDLARRERDRTGPAMTDDEVRAMIAEARASGVSDLSVDEIFAEALRRTNANAAR